MNIVNDLFSMRDKKYKEFHQKLIPTVSEDRIIGVRTPELRKYAKSIAKEKAAEEFLAELPHYYYEENNLHAFLTEKIKDFDRAIEMTEKFLPYVDNWATTDMFMPPVFKKNKEKLIPIVKKWIKSDKTYTVRYGVEMLLKLWLDEDFDEEYLQIAAEVKSDEYYVNMMIAWYFATALAKQYDAAVKYIEENRLHVWVHNKTVQKAIESNRIDRKTKEYLKSLKR